MKEDSLLSVRYLFGTGLAHVVDSDMWGFWLQIHLCDMAICEVSTAVVEHHHQHHQVPNFVSKVTCSVDQVYV